VRSRIPDLAVIAVHVATKIPARAVLATVPVTPEKKASKILTTINAATMLANV